MLSEPRSSLGLRAHHGNDFGLDELACCGALGASVGVLVELAGEQHLVETQRLEIAEILDDPIGRPDDAEVIDEVVGQRGGLWRIAAAGTGHVVHVVQLLEDLGVLGGRWPGQGSLQHLHSGEDGHGPPDQLARRVEVAVADALDVRAELHAIGVEAGVAAGHPPESVDYVVCTHLHMDHFGWNTHLVNGKWVPTFPKAAYLIDKKDVELFGAIDEKTPDEIMQMRRVAFADLVQPVFDAGLAKPVEGSAEVCDGVRLIPTPGHTPGHCSVVIESKGESALITGDFVHHPIQFHDPELSVAADEDNAQAIATRQRIFQEYADTPTLIIGTHFAGPTAGKLVRDGAGYRLDV